MAMKILLNPSEFSSEEFKVALTSDLKRKSGVKDLSLNGSLKKHKRNANDIAPTAHRDMKEIPNIKAGLENKIGRSSSQMNAQVTGRQQVAATDSELVKEQQIPFTKNSAHWKYIDSLEVFQLLPQKPHFRPLCERNEASREVLAIGHMLTFATLVEKASQLEIENSASVFESYLEGLTDLEVLGFEVKVVVDNINELLSLKRRQENLENLSKENQSKIAECDGEIEKLEEEIIEIDKIMCQLEAKLATKVSKKLEKYSRQDILKFNALAIEDELLTVKEQFKVKASSNLLSFGGLT
ncbi:protein of unknown function 724 7 [Euphorbia peplus]|nr:protein of unknown function 724 7 [Euphorbia peplus]